MASIRAHFAGHRLHVGVCAAAAVLVVFGIVFELPLLAILGVLACGAMMAGMVWMMMSMARHH